MKNSNKKGFTIVELVIVVAVIAILAAVLIPTFSGLIKKANTAADQQEVKNLNNAIAVDEALNGQPSSFAEVLNIIADAGYILENLNPKNNDCWYAWDEVTNQVLYLDKDFAVIYSSKALDAGADSIDDDKWHIAVNDIASFAIVAQKTSNVYLLGVEITGGENATIDLTGATLVNTALVATPITVDGGSLTITGGTVQPTGVVTASDGKVYALSISVESGTFTATDTVFDGEAKDGNYVEAITFYGGDGYLTNVTASGNGGTAMGTYRGSNVNITGGTYTVENYYWGALFVSGYGSNDTGKKTVVTVSDAAFHIDFGTKKGDGKQDYLFTVYGSEKGAELVLDGATITYTDNEDLSSWFQLYGTYSITISADTTFNGVSVTLKQMTEMFSTADVSTNADGAIVITNK